MKNVLLSLAVIILLTSCSKEEDKTKIPDTVLLIGLWNIDKIVSNTGENIAL